MEEYALNPCVSAVVQQVEESGWRQDSPGAGWCQALNLEPVKIDLGFRVVGFRGLKVRLKSIEGFARGPVVTVLTLWITPLVVCNQHKL